MAAPNKADGGALPIIIAGLIADKGSNRINKELVEAGFEALSRAGIFYHTKDDAVVEGRAIARQRMIEKGVGSKINRMARYNRLMKRIEMVIEQRALAYGGTAPGGASGLLAKDVRLVGEEIVEIYRTDTALMEKYLATMKQAGIEAGDFVEKRDITTDGAPIKAYIGVDIDRV